MPHCAPASHRAPASLSLHVSLPAQAHEAADSSTAKASRRHRTIALGDPDSVPRALAFFDPGAVKTRPSFSRPVYSVTNLLCVRSKTRSPGELFFRATAVSNVATHLRGLPRRRRRAPAVWRRRGGGTGRWRLPRRAVGSAVGHPRGEWRDRRALVHLALQCSVESKPDRAWLAWPKSLSAAEAGRTQTALRSGQPRPISRLGCAWHPGHIGPCLRHRRCAPESIGELTSAFFFYACTHGGPLGDIGSFAHMTHPTHTTRQAEIAEWLARPAALTRPLTTTLTPLVRALLL